MDLAEYCGPREDWQGRVATVLPDETYHLPLEQRTLRAKFEWDREYRTCPVKYFKILVPGWA